MIGHVPAPDKRKRFSPEGGETLSRKNQSDTKNRARDARPYTVSEQKGT